MHTELCDRFGIRYPIFVFTPSEKVAAAVTRAGGMGVLGCVRFNDAHELESVLCWMDDNTEGKPYGVDIVMPATVPTEGTSVDINQLVPQAHRDFVAKTLADLKAEEAEKLVRDTTSLKTLEAWKKTEDRPSVRIAIIEQIDVINGVKKDK